MNTAQMIIKNKAGNKFIEIFSVPEEACESFPNAIRVVIWDGNRISDIFERASTYDNMTNAAMFLMDFRRSDIAKMDAIDLDRLILNLN